jgi:hypothetical protein
MAPSLQYIESIYLWLDCTKNTPQGFYPYFKVYYICVSVISSFEIVGPVTLKSVNIAMCFIWLILLPCICRCIPFRYRDIKDEQKKLVEVLMINSQSGPGLLFPKVLWNLNFIGVHIIFIVWCMEISVHFIQWLVYENKSIFSSRVMSTSIY